MSFAGHTWPSVADDDRGKGHPHTDGATSAQRGDALRVELRLETPEPDPPLSGWLDVELARLARLAGVSQGLLGVAVVNDAEMTRLHATYQNVPETTDVLTFNMSDGPRARVEGDVAVCLDEAVRQASARAHILRHEVLLYALHGLLHLLGYDDTDPQDAMKMHRREDELLVAAGLGRVYATTRTCDGGGR